MSRFEQVRRVPIPAPKIPAPKKMAELISASRAAGEALLFENYSDVKLFYSVAKQMGLKGRSCKRTDNKGWDCWCGNEE